MNPNIIPGNRTTGSRPYRNIPKFRGMMPFVTALAICLLSSVALLAKDDDDKRPFLPEAVRPVSTVPANGDGNPYGVAFVPDGFPAGGKVSPGDILVSNFNSNSGLQGTGTTIVAVPAGIATSP